MKPTDFKEKNLTLKGDGDHIGDLSVNRGNGIITCCWSMSFTERVKALFTGRIWLHVMSEVTQPPVFLSVDYPNF